MKQRYWLSLALIASPACVGTSGDLLTLRDGAASCTVPLLPASPDAATCGPGEGCFDPNVIYVHTDDPMCAGNACMVYRWDQQRSPAEAAQREFCTCHCGGLGPGPFCTCPGGYACTDVFAAGSRDIEGSWCLPVALVANP